RGVFGLSGFLNRLFLKYSTLSPKQVSGHKHSVSASLCSTLRPARLELDAKKGDAARVQITEP
ncbi:hypothetical protein, partial [Oecophyllibacter saccharovorans]|uniref:hypothetical protein n=1 Tax=Oecophyllibacter saccharovorans TaxID=2558360 RepID=UPI0019D66C4A